jgi:hypothetical protein
MITGLDIASDIGIRARCDIWRFRGDEDSCHGILGREAVSESLLPPSSGWALFRSVLRQFNSLSYPSAAFPVGK